MRLAPRERAPAVRVVISLDADLVAVVGAWGAGQGRLEHDGEVVGGAVRAGHRPEARRIVAVEEVELDLSHGPVVQAHQALELGAERRAVPAPDRPPVLVVTPDDVLV